MNIAGGLVVPWDRPVYRETPVGHLVPEYALAGGRERPQLFRKRIPKGSGVTGPPIGERELELVDELVFVGLLPDLDEPVRLDLRVVHAHRRGGVHEVNGEVSEADDGLVVAEHLVRVGRVERLGAAWAGRVAPQRLDARENPVELRQRRGAPHADRGVSVAHVFLPVLVELLGRRGALGRRVPRPLRRGSVLHSRFLKKVKKKEKTQRESM